MKFDPVKRGIHSNIENMEREADTNLQAPDGVVGVNTVGEVDMERLGIARHKSVNKIK